MKSNVIRIVTAFLLGVSPVAVVCTCQPVTSANIGVGEKISLQRVDLPETDGVSGFNPEAPVRSVGLFGFYYNMAKEAVDIQPTEGSLTFCVKKNAPKHEIFLRSFYFGDRDMSIGTSAFSQRSVKTDYQVLDWSTATFEIWGKSGEIETQTTAYISRVFPAIRYVSDSKNYIWESGSVAFNKLGYIDSANKLVVHDLTEGNMTASGSALGAPWMMLWNTTDPDDEIFPLLITLQHKPLEIKASLHENSTLDLTFEEKAGQICIMLLQGIRRVSGPQTALWQSSIPHPSIDDANFWVRALSAFPIQNIETYKIDKKTKRVAITNLFTYDPITDDWGTKPLYLAPVPPVTARVYESGYPVKWESGRVYRSTVATTLGWLCYAKGKQVTYSIPIPESLDNMYASIRVKNDPYLESLVKKMETFCIENFSLNHRKDYLDIKELIEALSTFADKKIYDTIYHGLPELFKNMYETEAMNTVYQPAGGQAFLQNNSNYSSDKFYDKEWYNGRHLDIAWLYAYYIDPNVIGSLWPLMAGYYTYFRIHHDWAWSGVATQMVGRSLTNDGINFAFEGLLAAARMALMAGDTRLYNDATYLAAKQNVTSMGAFDNPHWAQSMDYARRHDYAEPATRIPAEEVYTLFMAMYNEFFGTDLPDPRSITSMSNGLNWNNPAQLREYATLRYGGNFVHQYFGLDLHLPDWYNKEGIEPASGLKFSEIRTHKPAAMHIFTRALLFGENTKILNKYIDSASIQQQYGHYIRTLQGIIQSNLPQAWVPVNNAHVIKNEWDGKTNTLTTILKGIRNASCNYDFTWRKPDISALKELDIETLMSLQPKPGPKPLSVKVNGKNVRYREIPGGFYRFTVKIKENEEDIVTITYDQSAK